MKPELNRNVANLEKISLFNLRQRLDKIENVLGDYIKSFVEPEAQIKFLKISKTYVNIEEKFESVLFLCKNYKILGHKLLSHCIMSF